MEKVTLETIHRDLETMKRDIGQIKVAISLEPELKEEIKQQVKEARERIAQGKYVSNKKMLTDFEIE